MGGATTSSRATVRLSRQALRKEGPLQLELIEAGAQVMGVNRAVGSRGEVRALELELARGRGGTTTWAQAVQSGLLQALHGKERREGAEQLLHSRGALKNATTQLQHPHPQLWWPLLLCVACVQLAQGFKRKRGVRLRLGRPSSTLLTRARPG